MTFRDLQKVIQSQSGPEQTQLLQRLRGKPFCKSMPQQQYQYEEDELAFTEGKTPVRQL